MTTKVVYTFEVMGLNDLQAKAVLKMQRAFHDALLKEAFFQCGSTNIQLGLHEGKPVKEAALLATK